MLRLLLLLLLSCYFILAGLFLRLVLHFHSNALLATMDIEKDSARGKTTLPEGTGASTIVQDDFSGSHDPILPQNDDIECEDNVPLLKQELDSDNTLAHKSTHRSRLILTVIFATFIPVALGTIWLFHFAFVKEEEKLSPYWQGFDHIENYFAFGDSWTDGKFWPSGVQPSKENPIGNPEFPGETSCNGINYIGYLTAKYNQSFIKTYNLALGGATVDSSIVVPFYYFEWNDFSHRIQVFAEHYITDGAGKGWRPNNTLFSMFYGINDLIGFHKSVHTLDELFGIYERNILELYDLSARNFLVMNVPPMDESPHWKISMHNDSASIEDFNAQIQAMVRRLRKTRSDINLFEYDVHGLVTRVISDPTRVSHTSGYKNTTGYCDEYEKFQNEAVPTTEQIKKCSGLKPDEYLWLNEFHVTEPIHEAIAAEIAEMLILAQRPDDS